jgi:hypothetical protein
MREGWNMDRRAVTDKNNGRHSLQSERNVILLCELGEHLQHAISAVRLVERELQESEYVEGCSILRAAIASIKNAGKIRAAVLGLPAVVVIGSELQNDAEFR